ncbi:efflux RND transporter permease subunit [Rossellomorea aquimaris]|uniref:Efflux RND transporter permease subunit n=1 Tax=Rossellomorea aquimaris TaxID=189382 RepID=A0A5D4U0P4_9BACI|nr:efflux RND transporter permease subunit [Rossellomorea aquimaris]TYS80843.1 efflux RND transporter permease subunit [Rossellomorea aquimaris]
MKLMEFIVKKKILVGLISVLVVLFGIYAVLDLDKELMPPMQMDGAYIEVNAEEKSAAEIERTITTPLEQKIQGVEGVEKIESTTNIGSSSLQLTFSRGKGEEVYKEIESIVNASASELPGIEDIVSGQYGASQSFEFFMDVSGGDMEQMTDFAKDILEPRLEELPEVRDVDLSGIVENEVAIEFNRGELTKRGLDINQVAGVISEAGSEATLGELSADTDSPALRWNTKLEKVEDIENIQIPAASGFIALKDIAEITLQPSQNTSPVWKDGSKDLIFVQVGRVSDVSQIEMADAVRAEIEDIRKDKLVTGFELNEMVAQADYVQDSIDGVASNILIGAAIAFAILLIFLRNIRATIIVGISIPTSVLLTFAAMWIFDYSLNMLTLIGLGLGIGMMVDSSIVILESIYKKKESGLLRLDAVIQGTKEVASAVIASMLTTIVVFLPIGLLGGEMGQFMIMLSAVVAFTLISSVLVSFTLIPALSENFLKAGKKKREKKESRFMRSYSGAVSWIVKKKRYSFAVISAFFLVFISSMFLVTKIPMTIMPDVFNRYAELLIDLETGIDPEDKEKLIADMTEELSSIQDVESSYIMDNGSMLYTVINMTKEDDITAEQKVVNEEIFKKLRALEKNHPVESVQSAMSAGGGYPVQVNIQGESFEGLKSVTDDFVKDLEKIDGIVGVTNSMERTSLEQEIILKEEAIEKAGLNSSMIQQFISQAFFERPIGEMSLDGEIIPLAAQWDEKINTENALLDMTIQTPEGGKKLSSFIELKGINTPNEISHVDGERFLSVSADIEGKDLGAVNREVQKLISDFDSPAGYSVSIAGDLEQQQELMKEMLLILGISIFLVYLVMAVQFNHLAHPIIVMSVIPMTFTGVILGLFLTQRELSVMSGMGIVMLIGIVLNNAILLIDRTNQLRNEGYSVEEALIEAGKNRIRPIFMTTLTTAGGMLPLALASGTSGNYQAPMATVIISGLMFATFITLLLIPAVYRLFTTMSFSFSFKKNRRKRKAAALKETEAVS